MTDPIVFSAHNAAVSLAVLILTGLAALGCVEGNPQISQEDISVFLGAGNNPYGFDLTSAQSAGDADVLISYPGISHFAKDADLRVAIDRLPGRVIAHTAVTIEFVFGKKNSDGDYFDAQILYPEDFDITALHDDKDIIAACRFSSHGIQKKYGPRFIDCRQLN